MGLCQFISYFGSKSKIGGMYPPPRYKTIVEPFAGGAGYSLRYHNHDVVLMDKNIHVYEVWKWLIEKATKEEILSLPVDIVDLRERDDISNIHKKFIGFSLSPNVDRPANKPRPSKRDKGDSASHWNTQTRGRIARQLHAIKHWRVYQGDYTDTSSFVKGDATWFIDPPYQLDRHATVYAPHTSKMLDFESLGDWCRSLPGQVIVCEQKGADWLPFRTLSRYAKGGAGLGRPTSAHEVVWLSEGNYRKTATGFFHE